MSRIVLHAGMHKTGSSSIQHSLHQSDDVLKDHGIALYPGFIGPNHSIVAIAAGEAGAESRLARTFSRRRGTTPEKLLADCLRDFTSWMDATSSAAVRVVSGEAFSDVPVVGEVRELLDGAEVFMYTRSPVSFAVSYMQQRLKAGATIEQVAAATLEGAGSWTVLPEYRKRLESLVGVFGQDRVHVRSFESAQSRLIDDFGEWVFGPGVPLADVRINESLGNDPAHLLHALNRLLGEEPDDEKRERLLWEASAFVRQLPIGNRFVPPAFDWGRFHELVKPDCAWLAEFSAGQIVYDDVAFPTPHDVPDFDWLAEPLMGLLHERAESRVQKQVFRRLFQYSVGREYRGPELAASLRATTDERFLRGAAHNFQRMGRADDAKICEDAAQRLADSP